MRSLLFVPGDETITFATAQSSADALIFDLTAASAQVRLDFARQNLRDLIFSARQIRERPRLFVRINGLETGMAGLDLDAIMPAGPDGIVLPQSRSGTDVQHLGAKLAVCEAENGLPDGQCAILAMVTETAASLFGLASYGGASQRLRGMAWSAQALTTSLGAQTSRLADGAYAAPYQLARTLTLVGARAAQVEPIDAPFTDLSDEAGLRAECEAARRDGFSGKLAIHPAQVPIINEVFGQGLKF